MQRTSAAGTARPYWVACAGPAGSPEKCGVGGGTQQECQSFTSACLICWTPVSSSCLAGCFASAASTPLLGLLGGKQPPVPAPGLKTLRDIFLPSWPSLSWEACTGPISAPPISGPRVAPDQQRVVEGFWWLQGFWLAGRCHRSPEPHALLCTSPVPFFGAPCSETLIYKLCPFVLLSSDSFCSYSLTRPASHCSR